MIPPRALLHPHLVILSIPSKAALASFESTNPRYAFTFETLNMNFHRKVNMEVYLVQLFIRYTCLVMTRLLDNCHTLLHIVMWCFASCILLRNALKSLTIAIAYFPLWPFWGPMNLGFAYDWELRGATCAVLKQRTLQPATLFSQSWTMVRHITFPIRKQRMRSWKVITCSRWLRMCFYPLQPCRRYVFTFFFVSLGRILLQGSKLTNLVGSIWH